MGADVFFIVNFADSTIVHIHFVILSLLLCLRLVLFNPGTSDEYITVVILEICNIVIQMEQFLSLLLRYA